MPISSSAWAKAMWPGVNMFWGQNYNEWQEEHKYLFDAYTSNKKYEEDVSTSGFGLASVIPEGGRIAYDTEQQGFVTRYTHLVYGVGFIVTRLAYEDDQYRVIAERKSKSLAKSMRQTRENVAANVYNRAENASYTGTGGKTLLNSAHPNIAGGTYSNKLSTAADLSEASLEQACIDIAKLTDDRGLTAAFSAQSLHLPVDSIFEIERILKSPLRYGTANNDLNALGAMQKFPKGVHINHYFTDSDAWYIRTDATDGMKCFNRRAMEFTLDNDWETENAKFKATERYSYGWSDPKGLFGSMGV